MKRFSLIIALITPLVLSSCAKEEVVDNTDALKIQFDAEETSSSRAAIGSEGFPNGSAFAVWGYMTKDTQTADVFDGQAVTKDTEGNWNCSDVRYWFSGWNYNFYGVYPSETSATVEDGIIKVSGFNTAANYGEQAVDLMTAASPVMSGDDAQQVYLNFSHELCKVRFTVKAESGIPATTVQKVILYGYTGQGNFSTETSPRWTLDGNPYTNADSPLKLEGNESLTDTHPIEGEEWLLIPQTAESLKLDFSYTQNDVQKELSLDLTSNGKVQWNAGKAYHYVVTVKSNAISFAQFVIDEWRASSTGGDIVIP